MAVNGVPTALVTRRRPALSVACPRPPAMLQPMFEPVGCGGVRTAPLNMARLGPGYYDAKTRRVGVVVSAESPAGDVLWRRAVHHTTSSRLPLPLPFYELRLRWARGRAADAVRDFCD